MSKISTFAASLSFLTLVVPCFAQPSTPSKPEAVTSESLLQRAHTMLPALSPADRMAVISELASSSPKKHRELAAVWMDEAFSAASHIPDPDTRVTYQIFMIQALSDMDSRAALDKLAAFDPPLHPGERDFRQGAARQVFDRFYRDHPGDVDRIIAAARRIGDTGSYPFAGVSNVLAQIIVRGDGKMDPASQEKLEAAGALAGDAVRYFRATATSDDANQDLAHFIRSYSKFIPPELLKPGLQELVARLMRAPQPQRNRMITMIPDKGDAPSVISHNHNDVLLAELMPLIRSVDQTWEQELRQSPEINHMADRLESGSAVAVLSDYSYGKSGDAATIQRLQASSVQMLGREQPEQALKALDEVSDPVQNAAAAANLALLLKDSRPEESAQLLARVQGALEKTKAPRDRITILYSMVYTLTSMRRPEELTAALDQSFAASDEIMAAAAVRYRASDSARHGAPGDLTQIVQNSARVIPEHTLERINDVRAPLLQAKLLMAMARGLDAEEDRAKSEGTLKAAQSKK